MNADDPSEGTSTGFRYSWPVPAADRDPGVKRESEPGLSGMLFPGAVALTPPPETFSQTSLTNYVPASTSTSSFTVSFNGPNVTFEPGVTVGYATNSSFMPAVGYAQPEPERLEIRRFYHWNKSATAGSDVTPYLEQREAAKIAQFIGSEVVGAHETLQVTKSTAVRVAEDEAVQAREPARLRRLMRRRMISPRSLTSMAVFLAGHERSIVGEEWRRHLLGEHGSGLTHREELHAARGFVLAALHYRVRDAADLAWCPADAVLRSRFLSNLFVLGPVIVALIAIVRHDGRFGLVADIQDAGELGVILYGTIRLGRWWRQIKPPEPKLAI